MIPLPGSNRIHRQPIGGPNHELGNTDSRPLPSSRLPHNNIGVIARTHTLAAAGATAKKMSKLTIQLPDTHSGNGHLQTGCRTSKILSSARSPLQPGCPTSVWPHLCRADDNPARDPQFSRIPNLGPIPYGRQNKSHGRNSRVLGHTGLACCPARQIAQTHPEKATWTFVSKNCHIRGVHTLVTPVAQHSDM